MTQINVTVRQMSVIPNKLEDYCSNMMTIFVVRIVMENKFMTKIIAYMKGHNPHLSPSASVYFLFVMHNKLDL